MEDKEFLKPRKKGLWIFLSVVILILLIGTIALGVGYYLSLKSPDKVYTQAINSFGDTVVKLIDSNMKEIDLSKNDISIDLNVAFDTNMDLEDANILKDYSYDVNVDLSVAKQIIKMSAGVLEKKNENELLTGSVFLQNNKGYIKVPDIFPYVIDGGEQELDFDMEELEKIKVSKEDYKKLILMSKDMLINTLDVNKFSVNEKVHNTYNDVELDVTEYIYLFDEENQKKTYDSLKNQILTNQEYLNILSKISDTEVLEIKASIQESTFEYEKNLKIILTTTGFKNEFVAIAFEEENEKITCVTNNNKISIEMPDNVKINIVGNEEKSTVALVDDSSKGTINLEYNKLTETKDYYLFDISMEQDGETFEFKMNGIIDYNANTAEEVFENVKSSEEITQDDLLNAYTNFMKKIEGTSLETFIQGYMMGLV